MSESNLYDISWKFAGKIHSKNCCCNFKVNIWVQVDQDNFFGYLFTNPLISRFLTFLTFRRERERYRDIYVEFAKFLVKRLHHDVVC